MHIKIIGHADANMRQLSDNLREALAGYPDSYHLAEVNEPIAIESCGANAFPALFIDGVLRSEGASPGVDELREMFRDRQLLKSKIYRLQTALVPVDMSENSANALRYAWKLGEALGLRLKVVFAMDSVFENQQSDGFLSGYKKSMQKELNHFVRDTLAEIQVDWDAPNSDPKGPGHGTAPEKEPVLEAGLLFGFPDKAIIEYTRRVDLVIMGTTGRGALAGKLFGSVSIEVSKRAHCPVLFVPNPTEFAPYKNLLYAGNVDSARGLQIRQAVSFANRFDGKIHFVHVARSNEKDTETVRKAFESAWREADASGPFEYANLPSQDGVTEALNDYAVFHRVDLLIFVTRRRSFWENLLHESITRNALLTGGLPILVIHADDDL